MCSKMMLNWPAIYKRHGTALSSKQCGALRPSLYFTLRPYMFRKVCWYVLYLKRSQAYSHCRVWHYPKYLIKNDWPRVISWICWNRFGYLWMNSMKSTCIRSSWCLLATANWREHTNWGRSDDCWIVIFNELASCLCCSLHDRPSMDPFGFAETTFQVLKSSLCSCCQNKTRSP